MTKKRWIILGIVLFVVVAISVPIALAGQIADRIMCDRGSARSTLEGPVKQEWAVHYHCRGDGFNKAKALAVDSQGNAYVTGWGDCDDHRYKKVTIKYNSLGEKSWVVSDDSATHSDDALADVAVDGSSNIWVTGTVKDEHDGHQIWAISVRGVRIAVDSSYHIYTVSFASTAKYDTNGSQLWARSRGGWDMVFNEQGDIYVTGDTGTVKYDENGNQLWAIEDSGRAIGADAAGNFYITGLVLDSPIVKYDSDGNRLWTQTYGEHGRPTAMAVDMSGNVYVTGIGYKTVKYDSSGSQLWVARYGGEGPAGSLGAPEAITVDEAGSVYVTGRNEYGYATVVKYDAEGYQVWAALYDGGVGEDSATDIALDASGNVYITGYTTVKHCEDWMFGSETEYTDFLTIRYSQQ